MVLGAGFFFCTSSRISGGAARPRLVSNVSVFSRKRTFRSPQVFESNENWGFGRDCWVSAGLFVRALLASGSEYFNGIFVWERPRSALRVEFLSSADRSNFQCLPFFVFRFQTSKLPNFQTQSASRRSAQISCRVPNPANLERCVPNSALLERRLSWAVRQHAFGFLRTVEYIPFTPIPPLTALPI